MRHEGVFTVQPFQEVTDRMSVITFQIQDDVACFFWGGGDMLILELETRQKGGKGAGERGCLK